MLAQATSKAAAAACKSVTTPVFHTSTVRLCTASIEAAFDRLPLQRNVVSTATPALRMTSSGVQATIFGATGFVGKYLTYRLGESHEASQWAEQGSHS